MRTKREASDSSSTTAQLRTHPPVDTRGRLAGCVVDGAVGAVDMAAEDTAAESSSSSRRRRPTTTRRGMNGGNDGDRRRDTSAAPALRPVPMSMPRLLMSVVFSVIVAFALSARAVPSAAAAAIPSSASTVAATSAFGPHPSLSSLLVERRHRPRERALRRGVAFAPFTTTSSRGGNTNRGTFTTKSSASVVAMAAFLTPQPVDGDILHSPRRRPDGRLRRAGRRQGCGGDPSGVICSVRGGTSADGEGEVVEADGGSDDGGDLFEEYGDVPVVPDVDLPRRMMPPIDDDGPRFNPNLGPTLGPDPSNPNPDSSSFNPGERKPGDDEGFYVPKGAIVLMDCFSPYAGLYLSEMARDAYGVAVINVLSNYVAGYLLRRIDEEEEEEGGAGAGVGVGGEDAAAMAADRAERRGQVLSSRVPPRGTERQWASSVPFDIVAVYCESDSGLDDAERLGVALGLTSQGRGDGVNPARRNKFLMNEVVGKAGLKTVKQRFCTSVGEALEFAENELGMMAMMDADADDDDGGSSISSRRLRRCLVVVKPPRGSGSDQVYLCSTPRQIATAFDSISSSPVFGATSFDRYDGALVQEFAGPGVEYAVDVVSKGGVHKIVALWRYDKRPVNGAPFVYHATELVDVDDPDGVGVAVCDYVRRALDALGVKWGLTHTEVVVLDDGGGGGGDENEGEKTAVEPKKLLPAAERCRLIEVNRRQHNTDFAPLTTTCLGYNALDALLAAYLGDDDLNDTESLPPDTADMRLDWDSVPPLPPPLRAAGAVVHLVCHVNGTLQSDPDGGPVNVTAMDEICEMDSVRHLELYPRFQTPGMNVIPTVDIKTDAGWVHLINDDPRRFREDYDRIVELMPTMFLVVEEEDDDDG